MRKTPILTAALLLLISLSIATAVDTAQDPAATTAATDISKVCSEITRNVKEGDSFKFCDFELSIGSFDKDAVPVNGEIVQLGQSRKFDGVKISYDEFAEGQATITLNTQIEKKAASKFERKNFKIFYESEGKPKLAGAVDAGTGSIAEIAYDSNTAQITIRSSTPGMLTLGVDIENANKTRTDKIHLPWNINRTMLQDLNVEKATQASSTELYRLQTGKETKLTLGADTYTISTTKLPGEETAAILLQSQKPFTVTAAGASQQTMKMWITTKLAQATETDTACSYDIEGSSLDDFARRSAVQGYYPSAVKFFDTFTDYCKDDNTLVNYGCVGLKDKFASTSRVAFLEVTCGKCEEGACTARPYCMDSDKYAPDQTTFKGSVTLFNPKAPGEALQETAPNYDNGLKLYKTQAFEDKCSPDGKKLTEYSCNPSIPAGYEAKEVECNCLNGACGGVGGAQPEEVPSPEAPPAAPPEDITELKSELKKLEDLVTTLKTMPAEAPKPTIQAAVKGTVRGVVQGIANFLKLESKPAQKLGIGTQPTLPVAPTTPKLSTVARFKSVFNTGNTPTSGTSSKLPAGLGGQQASGTGSKLPAGLGGQQAGIQTRFTQQRSLGGL